MRNPDTIKGYNRQICDELGVRIRTQAAVRSRELGLLDNGVTSVPPTLQLPQLPAFLTGGSTEPVQQDLFVGRDR